MQKIIPYHSVDWSRENNQISREDPATRALPGALRHGHSCSSLPSDPDISQHRCHGKIWAVPARKMGGKPWLSNWMVFVRENIRSTNGWEIKGFKLMTMDTSIFGTKNHGTKWATFPSSGPHIQIARRRGIPGTAVAVAHPRNRKWVTTLVIISGGNVHL